VSAENAVVLEREYGFSILASEKTTRHTLALRLEVTA